MGETWPAFLVSPFVDYARIVVDSSSQESFPWPAYIVGHRTQTEHFPLFRILGEGKHLITGKTTGVLSKAEGAQYPRSLIVLENWRRACELRSW